MAEKYLEHINEAEKILKIAKHFALVIFPAVKDKKILLKVLEEITKVIKNCISSVLQYEYIYKRINLYRNPKTNFEVFKNQCSKRFNINQNEVILIKELFELSEKHRKSAMEFTAKEKVVILSESLETFSLTIDKIKLFLTLADSILLKTKDIILRKI